MIKRLHVLTGLATMFLVMAMATTLQVDAQRPMRKILMEKHTGAWCQFCPMGAYAMDQTIQQYGSAVIGVSWHNRDAMSGSVESDQLALAQAGFVGGYPSGSLNRQRLTGGAYQAHPSSWAQMLPSMVNQQASVDVRITNVRISGNNMSIDIEAEFFDAVSGQLRFNALVVEDSCSGTGTGWDQVNAFNTQPNTPFTGRGNPIRGYIHRHVVRRAAGGAWGAVNSPIPSPTVIGTVYKQTLTASLESSWNRSRISVVGMVQRFSASGDNAQREILNATEYKPNARPTFASIRIDSMYLVSPADSKRTTKVRVSNPSNNELTFDLSIDASKSQIPFGWQATISPETITLPAGEFADAVLEITSPKEFETAELLAAVVRVIPQEAPGTGPEAREATVFSLSANAEVALVSSNRSDYTAAMERSMSQNENVVGKMVVLNGYNAAMIAAYRSQLKVIGFSLSSGSLVVQGNSISGEIPPVVLANTGEYNLIGDVEALVADGKRVFLAAPFGLSPLFNAQIDAQFKRPSAIAYFRDKLRITYGGNAQRVTVNGNQYQQVAFNLSGVDGSITEGLNVRANGSWSNNITSHDFFRINAGSPSKAILNTDADVNRVVGLQYEDDTKGGRLIFLTVGLESVDNDFGRARFLTPMYNWLLEGLIVPPKAPKIAVSETFLDFDSVRVKEDKLMTTEITNSGDTTLVVTKIEISGAGRAAYSLSGDAPTLPKSLAPGEKMTLRVRFAPPTTASFIGFITVTSNSENIDDNTAVIDLDGTGTPALPESVEELGIGSNSFTVVPNPAGASSTFLSFDVAPGYAPSVSVRVTDMIGVVRYVSDDLLMTAGRNEIEIPTRNLDAGAYSVSLVTSKGTVTVPMAVIR